MLNSSTFVIKTPGLMKKAPRWHANTARWL